MLSRLRRWFTKPSRRPYVRPQRRRTLLRLEQLEDRVTPTVLDLASAAQLSGTINSAIFTGASFHNETVGTGLADPFDQIQQTGTERGFNTNFNSPQVFDNAGKGGTNFIHAIQLSNLPVVIINGTSYYEFAIDINQTNSDPLLSLDQLQISTATNPSFSAADWTSDGTFNSQATLRYDMNPGGGGSNWVQLNAEFNSGSGNGLDMFLDVPVSDFAGASQSDYVYLYSQFGGNTFTTTYTDLKGKLQTVTGGSGNDGFEEWVRGRGQPLQLHATVATVIQPSSTVTAGATVYDTATVTAPSGGPTPGGTLTYYFYNTATPTFGVTTPDGTDFNPSGSTPGTQTVTLNGGLVPNSMSTLALLPGSYSFIAAYSGDSTYVGSIGFVEPLTVAKPNVLLTSVTTSADPTSGTEGTTTTLNDTATLSSTDESKTLAGTITFTLYDPSNTAVYTETDNVNSFGSISTNGKGSGSQLATQEGTYYWVATFTSSNDNYSNVTSGPKDEPVVIGDVPPMISGGGNIHVCSGDTAKMSGTFSDYDDAVTVSASVDGGAYSTVGITQDSGTSGNWSWSDAGLSVGDHTVVFQATNADGATATTPASGTFNIDVDSVSVAADHASVSVAENATTSNTGTFSSDDAVSISQVSGPAGSISQDSGNSGTWTWTQTSAIDEDLNVADRTVVIQATTSDGCTTTTSFVLKVTDVPPTITGGSDSHFCVGDSTSSETGTFSDYDDPVTISVTGGGTVSQTGTTSGTWKWDGSGLPAGDYTITVTATNDDGSSDSGSSITFKVDIDSVSVAADHASVSVAENATTNNTGTFSSDDAVTMTQLSGPGSTTQSGSTSGTWSWTQGSNLDEGTYTVVIQASIDDGCTTTTSFKVVVSDVPPTITPTNIHVCEGDVSTKIKVATFSDYDDTVTVTETSGKGSITQDSGTSGNVYWSSSGLAAGTYTVNLLATNADGKTATTSFTVSVGNDTPTVSTVNVSPSGPITVGTAVSVSGTWSDPGNGLSPAETYTGTINWGDGSPTQAITVNTNGTYSSPTHTYTAVATYGISVTISDGGTQDPLCGTSSHGGVSITVGMAQPKIVTTSNPTGTVNVGDTAINVSDTIVVSNGYNMIPGSLIVTLTGPGGFSYSTTVKLTGTNGGNGTYVVTTTLPTSAVLGTYTWTVSYLGNGNNFSAQDQRGPKEQFTLQNVVSKNEAATLGYWANNNGQALLKTYSGTGTTGSGTTAGALGLSLGYWLATTWPKLFGNLSGATGTQIATYFNTAKNSSGTLKGSLFLHALNTALDVWVTTSGLGWGTAAQKKGFMQGFGGAGLGSILYNVGNNGAAFGVANNTYLTVQAILDYLNGHTTVTTPGTLTKLPVLVFYGGNTTLMNGANNVLDGIDNTGDII